MGQLGIGLDLVEHPPTVQVGHHDVEGDRGGLEFAHQLDAVVAVRRRRHLKSLPGQIAGHELAGAGVVVDHNHQLVVATTRRHRDRFVVGDPGGLLAAGALHRGTDVRRQGHRKGRALAEYALDRDVPAHQLTETPADREAEARTAVLAGRRGVRLGEILKQLIELFGLDPDAGVAHAEAYPLFTIVLDALDGETDVSVLGELGGVAEKVEHDLAHLGRVGHHLAHGVRALDVENVAVFPHQGIDHGDHVGDGPVDVKRFEVDFHLVGLDLREIENIVDQAQEMVAR